MFLGLERKDDMSERHRVWWVLLRHMRGAGKSTHVSPRTSAGAIKSGFKRCLLVNPPTHPCRKSISHLRGEGHRECNKLTNTQYTIAITIHSFADSFSIAPRDVWVFLEVAHLWGFEFFASFCDLIETRFLSSPRSRIRLSGQ